MYASPPQRTRKRAVENQAILEERVARMETLFRASMASRANENEFESSLNSYDDSMSTFGEGRETTTRELEAASEPSMTDLAQHAEAAQSSRGLRTNHEAVVDSSCESSLPIDLTYALFPTPAASHESIADIGCSRDATNTAAEFSQPACALQPDLLDLPTPRTWGEESVVSPQIVSFESATRYWLR